MTRPNGSSNKCHEICLSQNRQGFSDFPKRLPPALCLRLESWVSSFIQLLVILQWEVLLLVKYFIQWGLFIVYDTSNVFEPNIKVTFLFLFIVYKMFWFFIRKMSHLTFVLFLYSWWKMSGVGWFRRFSQYCVLGLEKGRKDSHNKVSCWGLARPADCYTSVSVNSFHFLVRFHLQTQMKFT